MVARRALLWFIAVSLAVIAIASAALLWLRIAGEPAVDEADEEMAATSAESPLTELATAVGIDEDDCGRDVLYGATGERAPLPSERKILIVSGRRLLTILG